MQQSGCMEIIMSFLASLFFASQMSVGGVPSVATVPPTSSAPPIEFVFAANSPVDDQALLAESADILQERLETMDIEVESVNIADDGSIVLDVIPDRWITDDVVAVLQPRGLLEFVNFSDVSAESLSSSIGLLILTTANATEPPDPNAQLNPQTGSPFETIITSKDILSAVPQASNTGQGDWVVAINFGPEAAATLEAYTQAHRDQAIAIVLDGRVLSAPVVQAVFGESAVIAGNYTETEAKILAAQLNSNPLPVNLVLASIGG